MTNNAPSPDHHEAARRWPHVNWPLESYSDHVGDESPPHPVDLFLAGAAGHRITTAWEAVEVDYSSQVQRILKKLPLADCTTQDLWADTIARMMEDELKAPLLPSGQPPARIIRYRGLVKLLNYFVVIARRLAIQRKRRMKPTLSLTTQGRDDDRMPLPPDLRSLSPDELLIDRQNIDQMAPAVKAAYALLSPQQQFLIVMVYRQGLKQKEAGSLIGWSEFKTSRQLSAAMALMREALVAKLGDDWSPAVAAAWAACLSDCWASVQDSQAGASEPKSP